MGLNKSNCGEHVSIDEMKKIQVSMLETLADFCDANSINYFLDGGTLLGAVRHKGFIPWDDDIDVMIPHPECIKLQQISKGRIGQYTVRPPEIKRDIYVESWRMYDPSLVIESDLGKASSRKVYYHAYIDILQMEGLPNTEIETARLYRRTVIYRKILNCSEGSIWHGKTIPRRLFHGVMRPVVLIAGKERLFRKLQESKEQIDFDKAEYVGNMSGAVHTTDSRVLKEDYLKYAELEFEGRRYRVPGNYIQYLTQLYGTDSMKTLPPEDERKSNHNFKVYRFKE